MRAARVVAFALVLGAMAGGSRGAEPRTLTVSVAISLRPAVTEAARWFEASRPWVRVRINAAASGVLAQQARRGAPVDLLISASPREIERLAPHVPLGARRGVASNRIVIIVPASGKPPERIEGLAGPAFDLVAVGNPRTAPLGRYTQEVLESLGLLETLRPRLVQAENARQVLDYVARGEVAAGLVYRTDAALAPEEVVLGPEAATALHSPIRYEGAVLEDSAEPELAEAFLEYLTSPAGGRVLERFGFLTPG